MHDEAGVRVGAQTFGDQIAEGFVRPPPLFLVALGQLNRDFSRVDGGTSSPAAMLFSPRENANTADGEC
jgi:hypothetical protein